MTAEAKHARQAADILAHAKFNETGDAKAALKVIADKDVWPFNEMGDEDILANAVAGMALLAQGHRQPPPPQQKPRPGATTAPSAPPRDPPKIAYKAPFRFIELPERVVPEAAERARHDRPLADGYCAVITYALEAEAPLLIGGRENAQHEVEPMRLGDGGDYVIPGASIRGLLRAGVEIVARAKLGAANLHHRFGLRDFDHPHYSGTSPVSKVKEVKAGWLTLGADGKWMLAPCNWAHVEIAALAASPAFPRVSAAGWSQRGLGDKYAAVGMAEATFDFTKSFPFGPRIPAPYDKSIRTPGPGPEGVPVFSDQLPGAGQKKYEYVFDAIANGPPKPVDAKIVGTFVRLSSKPSKNGSEPVGSWALLKPTFDGRRRIPVFYVGDPSKPDGGFFGLTRLFKIPARRSVGEVLKESHPAHVAKAAKAYAPDFAEALFGYVAEPGDFGADPDGAKPSDWARKGRVACSFAMLEGGPVRAKLSRAIKVVQMAPRASFAPFYLAPSEPGVDGHEADYSAEQAPKLAGRKRYLPRGGAPDAGARLILIEVMGRRQIQAAKIKDNASVVSDLKFLLPARKEAPLTFKGEIRLHNVSAAEIGAILFALTFGGEPSKGRHMVGRAKAFGAGQMRLSAHRLSAEPNSGGAKMSDAAPFLKAFAAAMGADGAKPANAYLGMAVPGAVADAELDYMPLADFKKLRDATKPLKAGRNHTAPWAPEGGTPLFWK